MLQIKGFVEEITLADGPSSYSNGTFLRAPSKKIFDHKKGDPFILVEFRKVTHFSGEKPDLVL